MFLVCCFVCDGVALVWVGCLIVMLVGLLIVLLVCFMFVCCLNWFVDLLLSDLDLVGGFDLFCLVGLLSVLSWFLVGGFGCGNFVWRFGLFTLLGFGWWFCLDVVLFCLWCIIGLFWIAFRFCCIC